MGLTDWINHMLGTETVPALVFKSESDTGPVIGMAIEPKGTYQLDTKNNTQFDVLVVCYKRYLEQFDIIGPRTSYLNFDVDITAFTQTFVTGLGKCYLLGCSDGSLRLYTASSLKHIRSLHLHTENEILIDEELIASLRINSQINNNHNKPKITSIAPLVNASQWCSSVAVARADGTVLIWELTTPKLLGVIHEHTYKLKTPHTPTPVTSLACPSIDSHLWIALQDGRLAVFDVSQADDAMTENQDSNDPDYNDESFLTDTNFKLIHLFHDDDEAISKLSHGVIDGQKVIVALPSSSSEGLVRFYSTTNVSEIGYVNVKTLTCANQHPVTFFNIINPLSNAIWEDTTSIGGGRIAKDDDSNMAVEGGAAARACSLLCIGSRDGSLLFRKLISNPTKTFLLAEDPVEQFEREETMVERMKRENELYDFPLACLLSRQYYPGTPGLPNKLFASDPDLDCDAPVMLAGVPIEHVIASDRLDRIFVGYRNGIVLCVPGARELLRYKQTVPNFGYFAYANVAKCKIEEHSLAMPEQRTLLTVAEAPVEMAEEAMAEASAVEDGEVVVIGKKVIDEDGIDICVDSSFSPPPESEGSNSLASDAK